MNSHNASWVFGGLFAVFLMAVVAYRLTIGGSTPIDPTVNRILGVICAALAGLFAFFFSGTVAVQLGANAGSLGNIAVQATGGIGLFVLVLSWWRSNLAPTKAGGDEEDGPVTIASKKPGSSVKSSGTHTVNETKDDQAPSIHVGGAITGQQVIVGGTQTVHRDLTIKSESRFTASENPRETLNKEIEHLYKVLKMIPAEQAQAADEVRIAAEDAVAETMKGQTDPKRLEIRAEHLKRTAQHFGSTNPIILQIASEIAVTLRKFK